MANGAAQTSGDEVEYSSNLTDEEEYLGHSGYENSGEENFTEFIARYDTFPVILALLITAVNITVLVLFVRKRSLRTVTNSFLASLAVSDLLAGLVGIPLYISCSVTKNPLLCPPVSLVWRFVSISSVLHLLLVSTDRFIAIRHAMRYETIVTRKVFVVLTFLAWTLSAFVTVIQLAWVGSISDQEEEDEEEAEQVVRAQVIYDLCVLVLFFVVPLVTMAFIYVKIFITVRYHERQIQRFQRPSDSEYSPDRKQNPSAGAQRKTAIVFLAMLLVFIACWLPYFIISLQENLSECFAAMPVWVEYVFFYYARFVTSLTNPLLYVLGKRDFREALTRGCFCKGESKPRKIRTSTVLTGLFTSEQGNPKRDKLDTGEV